MGDVLSQTRSLCPRCLRVVPATLVEREGRVLLERTCPAHGPAEALVCSDADWFRWSRRFVRSGRRPAHAATGSVLGCPYDCGFCPEHRQHACVTVLEITEACNLSCPACFAGEAHVRHATSAEVEAMADAVLRAEGGEADVVMLSGGEPTLHPRFLEIADLVRAKPIRYVVVNSNGLRFARDRGFAAAVAERGMPVYLQFDGFSGRASEVLRGRDLVELKLRALENLAAAGATVVLVATLLKGVNDGEVGEIVRFAAGHPAVRAVSFQPEFAEGRHVAFDPLDRLTVADVVCAVAEQTGGMFEREDFIPIPCCDPICTAATYAHVAGDVVTPVTRLVDVEAYLDYVSDTAMPHLSEAFRRDAREIADALLRLFSKSSPAGSERQADAFACACGPLLAELGRVDELPPYLFAVTIEGFMDRWTFDVERAMRCCIQEALPDGRIVPFCVYNTLYRFAPGRRPRPPG